MKVKFITLNIWRGGNLLDEAITFLKEEDPDILAMQEVYNGQNSSFERKYRTLEVVKEEMSFAYTSFSPAFIDTRIIGNIDRGNAVFSKFPILSNDTMHYDVSYGPYDEDRDITHYERLPMCFQKSVIAINGKNYNICNAQGIWGIDGEDNTRRLAMSKQIAGEIKDKKNVILAGDFNVREHTKTIQNIERYLVNVFKSQLTTTFNMKRKSEGGFATSVVDIVFISRNIKVIDHYCPQVDVSDHLPLVCIFEI